MSASKLLIGAVRALGKLHKEQQRLDARQRREAERQDAVNRRALLAEQNNEARAERQRERELAKAQAAAQRDALARMKEQHRISRQAEKEQARVELAAQREQAARVAAEQKATETRSREELSRIAKISQDAFEARCQARSAERLAVLRSAQK